MGVRLHQGALPPDHVAVGHSVTGSAFSALLCGRSAGSRGRTGRTVRSDRGDNRPSGTPGGDFASGHHQGQCAPDESHSDALLRRG
ncbi:hypothetical protein BS329_36400 [Amycolatopsis coloradensis]|uniref:Uncharacterized protein n=1 Tax=Amycolatopsis coloradensis TaxID=76021 RepID=A0A1R0KG84_9PSEU|nr:hypothetical protein BS329_36400 [Amycolatopsis coloradensis]